MTTKEEKIQFVTDLSDRIRETIIDQINSGKVLAEWDGHELRTLLAYHTQGSADMSKQAMKGKRGKCFRNHLIIANM